MRMRTSWKSFVGAAGCQAPQRSAQSKLFLGGELADEYSRSDSARAFLGNKLFHFRGVSDQLYTGYGTVRVSTALELYMHIHSFIFTPGLIGTRVMIHASVHMTITIHAYSHGVLYSRYAFSF